MEAGFADQREHRQARRHRDWIAAQRAGLIDRAGRRDLFHQVTAPAIGAHRHAAADDLAEGGQVRGDAVMRLRTAERDAEAGHYFVEDQQRAVLGTQRAQMIQIAFARRDAVHVAGDRLNDQAGDIVAEFVEQACGGLEIIERQRQREVGQRRGYARRGRGAERQRTGTGLHQERIAVAVVAAFELDDARTPGRAARQPDRRHRGLGAGIDHAYHVDRRNQLGNGFGHRHLGLAGRAEAQAVPDRTLHGLPYIRMVVSDDHRSPGTDIVDVALAFDIPQIGPFGATGEERFAADGTEGAHRRVDAARHTCLGAGEQVVVGGHVVSGKQEW